MITVNKATELDSGKIIAVIKDAEESGFMLYAPGEREVTAEAISKFILSLNNTKKSGFFIARENDVVLGYIMVKSEMSARTSHRATIAVGVHSNSRGKGVGTHLFEHVIPWASQEKIHRLELTVIESNERAIHLYKKMGFEVEGIKKDSLLIKNQYVNELYMSLIL